MATKAKDSNSSLRKEKKVTPSSHSHTTSKQPNPRPTTTSSNTLHHPKDKSTKPVPNYLKPTFSSSSESLKLVNKKLAINSEDAANQKLLRRRSFDRPPSASRVQKSLISPVRKDRSGSRDKPSPLAIRSSSFSASRTPGSTPKPVVLERKSGKSFKPVKSQAAAETIKRSSSFSRTSTTSVSENASPNHSHDTTPAAVHLETKQETDKESLIQDVEGVNDAREIETPKAERKDVDADHIGLQLDTDQVKDDDKVNKPKEISSDMISQGQTSPKETQVEELTESELRQQDEEVEKGETHQNHSSCNYNNDPEPEPEPEPEESIHVDNAKVWSDHDHEDKEENANEEIIEENNKEENEESEIQVKLKEEEDHVAGISVEEEIQLEEDQEERKQEEDNINEVQKSEGGQGNKKETPTAYNDVIEKCKNKLLEKRKNKVKALVGAFETVIDYETANSK